MINTTPFELFDHYLWGEKRSNRLMISIMIYTALI
jgi:hypothetical protein